MFGFNYTSENVFTAPDANYGASLIEGPGNNTRLLPATAHTKSPWVQVATGANIAYDIYELVVNVNDVQSNQAGLRHCLVDIGTDVAGGTSYTTRVANLNCSNAPRSNTYNPIGLSFKIPLRIPAGASIAARCQASPILAGDASPGKICCWISASGRPTNPSKLVYGDSCITLGADTATSRGTIVNTGDNSYSSISGNNGAWVSLGTVTRDTHSWWVMADTGSTFNRNFCANLAFGDASNKNILIENACFSSNDGLIFVLKYPGTVRNLVARAGSTIYLQAVATEALTTLAFSAYGLTGGQY